MAGRSTPHPPLAGIVAIGASAGGFEPLRTFFRSLPPVTGIGYVVVPHPSLDARGPLSELLQNDTTLRRRRAEEGLKPRPGEIVFLSSDSTLRFRNGAFEEKREGEPRGPLIDMVLSSLADALGPDLVGVLLSGRGSHGTRGLQAVKAEGGIAMVQDPRTAEFAGMPSNAIRSGASDYHGPVAEVAAKIADVLERRRRASAAAGDAMPVEVLRSITDALERRTGRDLRHYNRERFSQRVQRRLLLHRARGPEEYARNLTDDQDEIDALFQDLVLGRAEFFQNAEAWAAFEDKVVSTLFRERPPHHPLRAWVPGCESGEEAYSLAVSLQAHASQLERAPATPRIFSTDIHEGSLSLASEGRYPAGITAEMNPSRVERFFYLENGHPRVTATIREAIVFALHDIFHDPPFARQALIVCRKLPDRLEPEAQEHLVRLLAYALEPGGHLFLGSAKKMARDSGLFDSIDEAQGIFRRNTTPDSLPTISSKGASEARDRAFSGSGPTKSDYPEGEPEQLRRKVQQTVLDAYSPAAILINTRNEVLQLFGPTRRYLEPSAAGHGAELIEMALPGLPNPLQDAIQEARTTGRTAVRSSVAVASSDRTAAVELIVRPVPELDAGEGTLLVLLREDPPFHALPGHGREEARSAKIDMEEELRDTRAQLQATAMRLESAYEELDALDRELQSRAVELGRTVGAGPCSEDVHQMNWFLATLGHELRNPLTPLQNSLRSLQEADLGEEERKRRVEIALRQVEHLARLVGDLFDVSKIIQGKITLRKRSMDLRELVREAVDDKRPELEDAGLEVQVDLAGEPLRAEADPHRLAQALGNLLDNARKYTPYGGTIRVRTRATSDDTAEVTVEDSGIGITREALARVFKPFHQGDPKPGAGRTGLGVGLALVRTIADAHGGSIQGESEGPGRGTRFTLQLPREKGSTSEAEVREEATPSLSRASLPRRILIVEDHLVTAETTSFVLVRAGHTVTIADSGEAALQRLADFQPDVLLCDLTLKGAMTGYDLARAVRSTSATSHIRLVALTGYGHEENRRQAEEAGFDAFLTKPVSSAELDLAITGGAEQAIPDGEDNGA